MQKGKKIEATGEGLKFLEAPFFMLLFCENTPNGRDHKKSTVRSWEVAGPILEIEKQGIT